jgi:hypothetical protein
MRQRTPADQWIASAFGRAGIAAAQGREGLKACWRSSVDGTVVVVLAAQLETAPVSSGPAGVRECGRAVAWLSPLAAVVSARTAVDDCRVGGGKESGACQPDARADGKPTGAAETARETDPLNGAESRSLRARFDRIFKRKTGFVTLDRLLVRLNANKSELLMVLDRPEIPLHTNGSENDIRCHVTRRKVSAGTRSDIGRDCRDAFLGLAKTCAKLEIAFWDYLGDRLAVPGTVAVPRLTEIILARAQSP